LSQERYENGPKMAQQGDWSPELGNNLLCLNFGTYPNRNLLCFPALQTNQFSSSQCLSTDEVKAKPSLCMVWTSKTIDVRIKILVSPPYSLQD
jgi:hypothetical protein